MNKHLGLAAFSLGLMAVFWVGYGYIASNPLALVMTALIGAFYLMGAAELRRFHQATAALAQALAAIPAHLPTLGDWLKQVPASLQNPVRLRVEGERVGLPGPAMTPYLVGLLVLLGMLGTFLGMVVTLNGAVMALESTTDLPTIRTALAAPVKGLGLAFGTSVAGVAASAMLGLLSALCRRERLRVSQALDTRIATELRAFSLAQQRQETLDSLQSQARLMPAVVEQLQALMAQMDRQSQALNERLLTSQDSFYRDAKTAYADLAMSVGQSLQQSLTEGARLAGATIQPVVEATMGSIARETTALHEETADAVALRLDGLSDRFGSTVTDMAEVWTTALQRHERSTQDLTTGLHESLVRFSDTFEQRSASLLGSVETAHAGLQQALTGTLSGLARETGLLHERMADTVALQLDGVSARFGSSVSTVSQTWTDALAQHQRSSEALTADLRTSLAASDQQRQAALLQSLEAMAATLQREWQQAGSQTLGQQEQICKTLEQTARDIHAQAQAQASETITEITRLMQAAAEAPRAAAEVMGALREKLSDSMARDNDLLDERSRIMATLGTLLDGVNHAATQQRGAIDALVASSAALLQQVGTQFTAQVEAESAKLSAAATQVTGSAVEVASLGETFGFAVQLFSDSNDALMAHLQRIEASLDKTTARSDEQLAYYVAQAREIIDLSIMSQQQIVEDLRQLTSRPAPIAGEVA